MTETNKFEVAEPGVRPNEETTKTRIDEVGSVFVSTTLRHWVQVTPGSSELDSGSLSIPCDGVILDADGTLDGETADGDTVSGLPLAGKQVHRIGLQKITAIHTATVVFAGWIRKPPA
jgi:hypothetical protein